MELTRTQFYLYVFLGQLVIGAVLGLIPLILGRKRDKRSLGNYGLLATLIAGALSPLAALIAVGIFVWLIVKKPAEADAVNNDPANQ